MNSYNLATSRILKSGYEKITSSSSATHISVYLSVNTSLFYFPTALSLKEFPGSCPRNVVQERKSISEHYFKLKVELILLRSCMQF